MKRLMTLAMLGMFSVGLLSGCNTVAGAGKDVQGAGEKVEKTANKCSDGKCRSDIQAVGASRPLTDVARGAAITPRSKAMKRVMTLLVLGMFSMAVLSGCNTVAGAGKDVQKAGEKVQDAAK